MSAIRFSSPTGLRCWRPSPATAIPRSKHWQALERKTKTEFDQAMQTGRIDDGFWFRFHSSLLTELGENGGGRDTVLRELVQNAQNSANWDQILPGTREALDRIGAKFRIAVI